MRAKLLHFGGKQLQRVYENLPDADKLPLISTNPNWYDYAVAKLDEYFEPGRQYILERCRLRKMRQEKNERFAHFVLRIRQQLGDCGLEKYTADVREVLTEIYVIDVIVEGCASEELRRRILQKDITLAEVESMGAMMEGVEQQVNDFTSLNGKELPRDLQVEKVFRVQTRGPMKRPPGVANQMFNRRMQPNRDVTCFNCGTKGHIASSVECKAHNQTCRRCKRVGHFEAVCRKRFAPTDTPSHLKAKKVRLVEKVNQEEIDVSAPDHQSDSKGKSYYCFYFGNESNILECTIGGISLNMLVDSGSDVNLIHAAAWESLKQKRVTVQEMEKGAREIIKGYGSKTPLNVLGSFKAEVAIGSKSIGKGAIRSRLDIRDAFLQTELAPESRDVTTFITSRGLFRFKRLPFGLVSAPEIFQKVMEEILAGYEGKLHVALF
ncbi:hypothetical protein RP20_CCG005609 [Aedes albopictus]|nr:hypothetical protein RP20_CCG005609 [Aedes albopictus]